MQKELALLGFDFGASSGRAMLGWFDGSRLRMEEAHRFANEPVRMAGRLVWDLPRLLLETKRGLAAARAAGARPEALGIDTWGVDYGLLDAAGHVLGLPVHYRDSRTEGMQEAAFARVPREEIFRRTGIAFNGFNTLFQLLAASREEPELLAQARTLLFLPDLLAYLLTGERGTEFTIASTSQMLAAGEARWDIGLLEALGIPAHFLTEVTAPGTGRGRLLAEIGKETGVGEIPLVAVASHDTASAVAAVPAKTRDFAYISSGTWSLLGTETDAPLCTQEVLRCGYTNEGGVCGTTRLLRNIMGLWILQECKREWDREGGAESFAQLAAMAESAPPFLAVIDVDDPGFLPPGGMPERIREYCRRTGQSVPETKGEISRVVYEGLALKYRQAVEQMEERILRRRVEALHIVGGGSRNALLNRLTAQAVGKPVLAGPGEATAAGNLLAQAMALGEIGSLSELREVVGRSFPTEETLPGPRDAAMEDAYGRLLRLTEGR